MGDIIVEFDGQFTLDQTADHIDLREARHSEFIASELDHENNVNAARFMELPAGTRPARLSLVSRQPDTVLPPGTRMVWTGWMLVQGKSQLVTAYRPLDGTP